MVFLDATGVIHLFNTSIKGYKARTKVYEIFSDVVLWYALLIGLLIMLIPSELFASIAQMASIFHGVRTINRAGDLIPAQSESATDVRARQQRTALRLFPEHMTCTM